MPAGTIRVQFEPPQAADIQFGDILGFQTPDDDLVISETFSSSPWRNAAMSRSVMADWLSVGTEESSTTYTISYNILSDVSAVFSETLHVSSPGPSLSYISTAGDYTFTSMLRQTSLGTCTVTVVDDIAGFLWIFPVPTLSTVVQGSTSTVEVKVASGQMMNLVVKVLKGTNPTVSWTFSGSSTHVSNSLENDCPASISPVPESCSYSSSFLSAPYASLEHSFSAGVSPVSLTIHASNDVSFAEMRVSFQVYAPITNVEFYHQDCQTYSKCEVYLEEGVLHEFFVRASGDIEDIVYLKDGTVISPTPTTSANLSMTFSMDDDVILSVNVSNSVSWMKMDLIVHVRIRANFGPVNFDSVLDKVALGVVVPISAKASVTFGAPISVTWIIGDVNTTYDMPSSLSTLTPSLSAHTFKTSGNVSVTILLEDPFGDSVSDTMVVEVYKIPDTVVLASSLSDIATGEQFELFIRVDNCSTSDEYHYDQIIFSVDWGTGTSPTVWRDSSPLQSLTHQIDTAGAYTVTVMVSSQNDPSITKSATVVLNLHDIITGLRLSYDGPKHVSEQITFTATVRSGTSVMYTLEYDDRISSQETSVPTFIHQYAAAGVYKAIIRAQNAISVKSSSLTLYAYDEKLVQIIRVRAPHCSPVNTTVTVSTEVAAQLPDSLDYTWSFGNGDVKTAVGLDSASTIYHNIGNFYISLEVENVTGSISDNYNTQICIEESISGLTVQYRSPVALMMPGALEYVDIVASVLSGSNMTYEWAVNGEDDVASYDVLNLTITQAGTYNITVTVANDLDSTQQEVQLVAMEIISGLSINCLNCSRAFYCMSQTNTSFQAIKEFGTHENYTWTLSDGSELHDGDFVMFYFLTAGNYTLDLVSMNEVSTVRESTVIHVQDQIKGFSVQVSESTAIVGRNLTFQGDYSAGTSLIFQWECDQIAIGNAVSDSVFISFSDEGHHNCSVLVSNEVSSANETFQVTMLGQVANISVNHSLLASQHSTTEWYATLGQVYTLEAVLNTHFLVTYQWEITQSGSLLQSFSASSFTYSFASPGSYDVSLLAGNSLSSDKTILTVTSQEPVSGLKINTSSHIFMIVGTQVSFEASLSTGSDVTYTWTVNSTVHQSDANPAILEFSTTGIFVVTVVAANNLGFETDEVVVNVFEPVSGVAIQLSQNEWLPFVSLTNDLGISVPNVSGSDLLFQWTIMNSSGDTVLSSNLEAILYSFASPGLYTIHIEVSNPVSSLTDSVNIDVQGTVDSAQIVTADLIIATGSSIMLTADVNAGASNLTYTWKMDGVLVTEAESFSLHFPATGTYLVSLRVENNISSSENKTTVRVLDPVSNLQIVDCVVRLAQSLTSFNSSIDSGTNVSFVWSVMNDNTSKNFAGQNITYTFPDQGVFNISLTASNDVGSSFTSCIVEAHLPIGNISLDISSPDPDYIFVNLPVTFVASGGNLQLATFTWNITGQAVSVSSSNTYIVTFAATGTLDLTVDIENGFSQVSQSLRFTIKDFQCSLPQVRSVGAGHQTVLRSHTLELEVTVDPQDCTQYIAVHTWRVYQTSNCNTDLTTLSQVGGSKFEGREPMD